jgi:hypothetical protein
LDRINEEEKTEAGALTELMYNQLEKLKEGLEDKIPRLDVFDKRSLAILRLADNDLSLEPTLTDEEE